MPDVLRSEVIDAAGEWAVRLVVGGIIASLFAACAGIAAVGLVLAGIVEVSP